MKYLLLLLVFFFYTANDYPQDYKIKGNVSDLYSNQAIAEANVIFSDSHLNTVTDSLGNFLIGNIPEGEYILTITHIGYLTKTLKISFLPGSRAEEHLQISLVPDPVTLNDIYVTSTKYEKNLKEVPLPLEVMTDNDIKKLSAVTVSDLLKNKPGISIVRDGIWGTTVNIRGLSRSGIITLIDGNRIETATDLSAGLSLIDVNNIQRIEVIKGAASSLYGTGALGGIVNVISKNGQYSDNFTMGGSFTGSFNSVNNGSSGNISLNAGAPIWFAHFSGSLRNAENTKTPVGPLNNSQFNDNSISADLGIIPLTDNEIKFNYQRFYAKNVGIPGGNSLFPSNALVSYPNEERNLFSAEYKINNISTSLLKVSLKYFYQYILRDVKNIPGTVTKTPAQNGQPAKQTNVLEITPNARHYTNGIQMQTDWMIGKQNYLIAGIDAWQRQLDSRRERSLQILTFNVKGDSVIKTVNQTVGERPLPESRFRSIGFYAQDEITLIKEKLKMTIGGRFDQINISNNEVSNPVYVIVNGIRNDFPANSTINWKSGKADNYSWSGNLDLLYSLTKGFDLNFNLARSFRSPSLEERYKYIDQGNIIYLGDPELKPEQGISTDAGIRIYNGSYLLNLGIFLNNLTDMVVDKPSTYEGRAALKSSNVGKARLYGFDMNVEFPLVNKFICYTSASFVIGKDVEKDLNLPQMPPLNGKLGLRMPIREYVNLDVSSTIFAAQNNTSPGEIKTPGYAYFDLFLNSVPLSIGNTNLIISTGIENIFDKAYRNHLASNRGLISMEPGRNLFLKMDLVW